MPSLKKSVMFAEPTVNYIQARTKSDDDISWSQELNETFKALKWLSDECLPDLTETQWQHILNVYASSHIEFHPPYRIASDIMDSTGEIDLDELQPDLAETVKIVHKCSQAEQFAIMDFVKKFWSHNWSGEKDFEAIVDKIKAL